MLGRATPQHRLYPRQEFLRAEGFDDIVVGAAFEPGDAVHLFAARGQQDDRQAARAWLLAQLAASAPGRTAGQHPVDQGNIRQGLAQEGFGVLGAVGAERLVTTAQQAKRSNS
jgi:hypothetical protein